MVCVFYMTYLYASSYAYAAFCSISRNSLHAIIAGSKDLFTPHVVYCIACHSACSIIFCRNIRHTLRQCTALHGATTQHNTPHPVRTNVTMPLSGKVQSFLSSKQDKDVFKWVNRTVLPVILKDDGTARWVIRPTGGHRVGLIVAGAAVWSSVLLCLQRNEQLSQPLPHQPTRVRASKQVDRWMAWTSAHADPSSVPSLPIPLSIWRDRRRDVRLSP